MIKNIIFDVGNVLMDYDSEAYMIRLGFDADTRRPSRRPCSAIPSGTRQTGV